MTLEYEITPEDYAAFKREYSLDPHLYRRVWRDTVKALPKILILPVIALTVLVLAWSGVIQLPLLVQVPLVAWLSLFAFTIGLGAFAFLNKSHRRPRPHPPLTSPEKEAILNDPVAVPALGKHKLTIDDVGILEECPNASLAQSWRAVSHATTGWEHVYIGTSDFRCFIVPHRALRGQAPTKFVEEVEQHIAANKQVIS